MLIPIIAAIALASITVLEKIVLRKKKIKIEAFQLLTFLSAVIVMLPLLYFFWKFEPEALQMKNILILSLVIITAVLANISTFYALKWEKVSNIEPALIMEPLFIVMLALIFSFFTTGLYERNFTVIIPALIAGFALILSHVKKHHLSFNKYFLAAILGALLYAIELVISVLILDFYSPISFYFFRSAGILVLTFLIFRPKIKNSTQLKTYKTIFLIGALWVLYRVSVYYGFLQLGVIFTTLIIMLGPVFVYLFAKIFLHEKLSWRNILAAIIIVICVLYVTLF